MTRDTETPTKLELGSPRMNREAFKTALARNYWLILLLALIPLTLADHPAWPLYWFYLMVGVYIWLDYRDEAAKTGSDEEAPYNWRDRLVATVVLVVGGAFAFWLA